MAVKVRAWPASQTAPASTPRSRRHQRLEDAQRPLGEVVLDAFRCRDHVEPDGPEGHVERQLDIGLAGSSPVSLARSRTRRSVSRRGATILAMNRARRSASLCASIIGPFRALAWAPAGWRCTVWPSSALSPTRSRCRAAAARFPGRPSRPSAGRQQTRGNSGDGPGKCLKSCRGVQVGHAIYGEQAVGHQ